MKLYFVFVLSFGLPFFFLDLFQSVEAINLNEILWSVQANKLDGLKAFAAALVKLKRFPVEITSSSREL